MLERLPVYATYLEKLIEIGVNSVSSSKIAKDLKFGEVQVRKELAMVSGTGKPRIGYDAEKLLSDIRIFLGEDKPCEAVIVGAGKLGRALLGYGNFDKVGVKISAAFDIKIPPGRNENVFSLDCFNKYCKEHSVSIGIITVPATAAQTVCDIMIDAGIKAIWNFAPMTLHVPSNIAVINEKLSISLSQLRQQINM